MTHRRAGQQVEGGIVLDAGSAWAMSHHPAMPVAHVLAQADVGDDHQLRQFPLQQPNGLLDDAVGCVRFRSPGVLALGNAEEQHRRHAGFPGRARLRQQLVRRKLEHPGHGPHRHPLLAAGADKQRQDQLLRAQPRLGHQLPQRRGATQPARTGNGKRAHHGCMHVRSLERGGRLQSQFPAARRRKGRGRAAAFDPVSARGAFDTGAARAIPVADGRPVQRRPATSTNSKTPCPYP